ncbi:MAG: transporter permease [Devosia sp.]|nr:transporter permease [Devosia sp.]
MQVTIHGAIAEHIQAFSGSGDWLTLLAVLPMGMLFGAAHGLTPGHNKTVLASYVVGDGVPAMHAGLMALVLTAVHVGSSVFIALGAGFLVSRTITSAGQAPLLETASRVLLLGVGLWLVLRSIKDRPHVHGEGFGVAIMAGIVPCPLTLFVMVFALSQGVPEAGLVFAFAMLAGVGTVLAAVALAASLGAKAFSQSLTRHGTTAKIAARSL